MITEKDKKNFLISGIFIFLTLFIVMGTLFLLNKENSFLSKKIILKTDVQNAQNLKDGAVVQLRGVKIGTVKSIEFKNTKFLTLFLKIDSKYQSWIKKDATVSFKNQGVLGDKFLEISGGSETEVNVNDGDQLNSIEIGQFDQIINKSEDIIIVAKNVLQKLDHLLEATRPQKINKVIDNLEKSSENANKLILSLNDKNLSPLVLNLKNTSDNLNAISNQIKNGPGSIHSFIYDQGLYEDLKSLLGGANRSKVLKFFIKESIKKGEN